jgi:putative NIF3 family GTP cyclohydrolase 1 type 2
MRKFSCAAKVLEEAIGDNVGVIVAYHPPLFRPVKRLTLADTKQEIILKCIASGISVFSPHTSLDSCVDGSALSRHRILIRAVNDWLGSCFKGEIKPIKPAVNPPNG